MELSVGKYPFYVEGFDLHSPLQLNSSPNIKFVTEWSDKFWKNSVTIRSMNLKYRNNLSGCISQIDKFWIRFYKVVKRDCKAL